VSALEPSSVHVARCAVWLSDLPCDCGADDLAVDMPLLRPDPGSLAEHLDHIEAS
jgi:hypothetical protein